MVFLCLFFQAEDGIRDLVRSRGLVDVYKRQEEILLLRLLDEEYTRHPFFGSRRMVPFLRERGWVVNRKRVQRLMPRLGWAGRDPGSHTRRPHPERRVYPSLLRGVAITQPHQAWSTAITDQRLARGWGQRVAIIDW